MPVFLSDFEAINVPPRSARVVLPTIRSTTRSSYAGVAQSQNWNDGPLILEMTFPPMLRETAERLIAFKASLDLGDGRNPFLAGIGTQGELMGAGAPAAIRVAIDEAVLSQNLQLKGFQALQTKIFKAGDWLQLGSGMTTRLYKNLYDVDADLLGNATLQIRPGLRLPAFVDDLVTVAPARGIWELIDPDVEWDIDVIGHGRMTLQAIEAMS